MTKSKLSIPQVWNMCFGFLGIQIGFELQNNNVSRIFQTLGAEVESLAILWIAAPLTGLIVQPIVGHFSDKTWGRLGRRRPYFLVGAILATLALFVMPNSPTLWVAAGMLWVMDASLNITMEPFRAFVGDNLPDEQRTQGYAMQSFFIGIGAVGAGALPWVLTNWFGLSNTAPAGQIPLTVHIAFYAGGAALFLAVLWTVISTREYSPDQLQAFEAARRDALGAAGVDTTVHRLRPAAVFTRGGLVWLGAGAALCAFVLAVRLLPGFLPGLAGAMKQELYVLAGLIGAVGGLQLVAAMLRSSGREGGGFMEVVDDLFDMPLTMKQLAIVQFFSWFALFAMWIYGTPAVAAYHFGAADAATEAYQDAGDWWSLLGSVRNATAAIAALAIMWLAHRMDRRHLHALCLGLGALGFASMFAIREPSLLWISMVLVGIAWAAIVSVPYAILSGAVPAGKMGIYMGIFNIFIVVPQLLAATLLGLLLGVFFDGQAIFAFALATAGFALAALAVLFVKDAPEDASPDPLAA
jgi:maltose/moltooligosaccharide transporter